MDGDGQTAVSARDGHSSVWSIAESLTWTSKFIYCLFNLHEHQPPPLKNRGADKELRWANHNSSIKAFHRVKPNEACTPTPHSSSATP